MTLEINIETQYLKILNEEPFEFETLKVTETQLTNLESLAIEIENLIAEKFCFNHEKSRVHISISWHLPINGPFTSINTCCPTFAERLQQTLLKIGIVAHVSFLRALQSPSQN